MCYINASQSVSQIRKLCLQIRVQYGCRSKCNCNFENLESYWEFVYVSAPSWWHRKAIPILDVFFFGFWFRWFFLRLSGILCGITSSLRIRKNFFDFSWFKLLRALFRFHIIYKKKEKKILSLVRLEHTTLWVRPYCSINWAIMSIDIK